MNYRSLHRSLTLLTGTVLLLAIAGSCKKLPVPDFSYLPADNPEAGDTIIFINSSTEADSYEWSFGDGNTSTDEEPQYIYSEAGIYDVKLTAENDRGSESASQDVTINEPTILGFIVYDSADVEIVFEGATVLIYDNAFDWENFNEPQFADLTDADGFVVYSNLEPIVYYIWVFKEGTGGLWGFGGSTPGPIVQNEINVYTVPLGWVPDTKKRASGNNFKELFNNNVFQNSKMTPRKQ